MEQESQPLSAFTKEGKCMNFFFHTLTQKNALKSVHRHDFYQILLLTKGTAEHTIDFETHHMDAGSVSVLFPHQVHHLLLSSDAEAHVVLFDETVFCSALLNNELRDYNVDLKQRINMLSLEENHHLFPELMALEQEMQKLYQNLNPVRKMEIKFLIKVMLLKIIDAMPQHEVEVVNENDTLLYNRFRERVDEEYKTQRKVIYYADLLGVSAKKLTAVCQHYSGLSPLEIIHERLSVELKKALALDEMSFKEVAFDFGFSSQSALNKFIGLKFGLTPLAFREELQRRASGIQPQTPDAE